MTNIVVILSSDLKLMEVSLVFIMISKHEIMSYA